MIFKGSVAEYAFVTKFQNFESRREAFRASERPVSEILKLQVKWYSAIDPKDMDEQNNQNDEAALPGEKNELQKCEMERKEYLDGWQRAKADYLNYKKDEGKRFEDMARFVTTGLIQDIFPILDSFDLALQSMQMREGNAEGHEQGILLIRSQFMDMLKRRGVAIIEVRVGEKFNPECHESIGEMEAEFSPGSVAEEIQKGYIFHDRVLRPARVRIAKIKE